MHTIGTLARFAFFAALSVWFGYVAMADPAVMTLAVPERDLSLVLPVTPEGWRAEPSEGDQLLRASTRLRLATLEVVDTGLAVSGDLGALMAERAAATRATFRNHIIWEQGAERFAGGLHQSVKWTARQPLAFLPLTVEYWSLDYYIPHQETYLRLTLRYPNFMWRYFRPDRMVIGSSLRLAR